jgi:ABC-2 type transport system permease protein
MVNWIGLSAFIQREIARIFRVVVQTIVSPLISAFLFIFIFGFVLGQRIELIAEIPYMRFVFPGILMMNVLTSAFMHSSNSLYFVRFTNSINELLTAPFSYLEMIVGFVTGAVVRGLIVGVGVLTIGLLFGAVEISHPTLFLLVVIGIAVIFALLGLIVGLWAKGFEQLNILNTFVIMPLSFLGGMFYSVTLLPEAIRTITLYNPFFYFVDAMRFATIGYSESNLLVGGVLMVGLVIGLGALTTFLFMVGWRLRE